MGLGINTTQIKNLTVGVLVAYAITAIVFLAFAMMVTYTNMSERSLPTVVAVTTFLSVLVAGFDAAKGAAQKGWLWGMAAGGIYILIMAGIMVGALPTFAVDTRTFIVILLGIAGGGLGGMIGINLRK